MSSSSRPSSPARVLQPKQQKTSSRIKIMPSFFFSSKLRRHSNTISQSLQEAEESERHLEGDNVNDNMHEDSLQDATGIPIQQSLVNPAQSTTSSCSSSWSSTPAEVPYSKVGGASGSFKQHHAMPSPEYLAMMSSGRNNENQQHPSNNNNITMTPALQQSMSSEDTNTSWQHFSQSRIETFPASSQSAIFSRPPPPRILTPKRSRFQEFWDELKDLIQDLLHYGRTKTWKKKVLTVLLCCICLIVFYDLIFDDHLVTWLHAFMMVWMTQHSTLAVLAFVGIFVVATLIFIPPTLLVFGAGYAFTVALDSLWQGIIAATISCFLGSALGAVIAFLRARYMMRDLVYLFSKRYPLIRVADRCLKSNGFRIMVLLRMCPLLPFNGLNYVCGITGVSLQDFCTSLIGILPFYVYTIILGATAGQLRIEHLQNPNAEHKNQRQHITWIVLIATGVVFGLIAMVYTWRLVKAELKKELSLSSEEFEQLVHGESVETVQRSTSSNRVTTILSYDPEAESGEVAITCERSAPYHLQDGNDDDDNDAVEIKWMEDGEEWYWVWA